MDTFARRMVTVFAVTVGISALVVPIAAAQHPDDRAGMRGVGAISAAQADAVLRPDDRVGVRGPGRTAWATPVPATTRPDDRAEARGPGAHVEAPVTVATADDGGAGVDWGNTLGAAGFVLLLGLFAGVLIYNGRLERRPI
jgi:hypothetical protein